MLNPQSVKSISIFKKKERKEIISVYIRNTLFPFITISRLVWWYEVAEFIHRKPHDNDSCFPDFLMEMEYLYTIDQTEEFYTSIAKPERMPPPQNVARYSIGPKDAF